MYRGISDSKKGYHSRTNIVKYEKGDLVADSHSILARWRNLFSQLLNVVEDVLVKLNVELLWLKLHSTRRRLLY